MVLSLIFFATMSLFSRALFSALRGTVVQLAGAENNKSDKFCPFYRGAA